MQSDFYSNPVAIDCRSWMNVPFILADAALDAKFLEESAAAGLTNLKGHRSVGGMRASSTTRCSEEAVDALIEFMADFEKATWLIMYKILTLNNIAVEGLRHLPRERYEVASEIAHPDAILLRSYNMHDMEIPDTVAAIGRAGAGTNNIPVDAMSRTRRSGVQRAGRKRQCGQGTGDCRPVARRSQSLRVPRVRKGAGQRRVMR